MGDVQCRICAQNHAMPTVTHVRNTSKQKLNRNVDGTVYHAMEIGDTEHKEGEPDASHIGAIDLNATAITAYILQLSTIQLLETWNSVAVNSNADHISIPHELRRLFLRLIFSYIEHMHAQPSRYEERAKSLSVELCTRFQSVLATRTSHVHDQSMQMSKLFYLEHFQLLLSGKQADLRVSLENLDDLDTVSPEQSMASTAEYRDQPPRPPFDMLQFISTSSTVQAQPNFNAQQVAVSFYNTLKAPKRSRDHKQHQALMSILATASEKQRVDLANAFQAQYNESLQSAMKREFGGHLLALLLELSRSSPYNDAEWIEKARMKQNFDAMNEILLSRTNAQLSALKSAYMDRFGVALLDALLQSLDRRTGSYVMIVQCVLSDDAQIMRKENVEQLQQQHTQVYDDAKLLYRTLETKKEKFDKSAVIQVLCRRSWSHLALVCNEYGKKSMFDLRAMIERRFGKHSKSGHALQCIIDVARNRHSFFAQLLHQSFNKMSTDHDTLIRILVGRSEIDLGEIIAVFSQKYGNGNTLFQFIKNHTKKGLYRTLLLRLSGMSGDRSMSVLSADDDEKDPNDTFDDVDEYKVPSLQISGSYASSVTHSDTEEKDLQRPTQTWAEFIRCAPTVHAKANFDAVKTAHDLFLVMQDRKNIDMAKKTLIETITGINRRQRKELQKAFHEAQENENGLELADAVRNLLQKGKTMTVLLMLLLRPAEFHCFWLKQAIKRKDMELLVEVLCSLSNYEIIAASDFYFKSEKSDLIADIQKHIIGNKKTAQWIISKMLEAKRPEYVDADKKLGKAHLTELAQVLQRKQSKECKQFFAKLFVENAYSQIKYEMDAFNMSSEKTLASVVKKTMGNGHSALILEHILAVSNNRYAYFCEKLRDAMKGMGVSQDVLIRILIGRSEKDLADIIEYFAANNYGEGTTLKQCLENAVSGSFRTSLLRIAGLYSSYTHLSSDVYQEDVDYESRSDTESVPFAYSPRAKDVKTPTTDLKSAEPLVMSSDDEKDEPDQEEINQSAVEMRTVVADTKGTKSQNVPKPVMTAITSVSVDAMNAVAAINSVSVDTFSPVPLDLEIVEEETQLEDVYDINEEELGRFIMEKLNEETAEKLIQRLKKKSQSNNFKKNNDDDAVETIEAKQIIFILLFACILFMKYKQKVEKKRDRIVVDNKQLKRSLMPAYVWILQTKFQYKQSIKKSDYKLLGAWLIEYYGYKS